MKAELIARFNDAFVLMKTNLTLRTAGRNMKRQLSTSCLHLLLYFCVTQQYFLLKGLAKSKES